MILQTDYTRRIWTGLTTDDWGEANLQEGDVIYLMDASECYVGGEGMMYQLPDLGGGGGGGYKKVLLATGTYTSTASVTTLTFPINTIDSTLVKMASVVVTTPIASTAQGYAAFTYYSSDSDPDQFPANNVHLSAVRARKADDSYVYLKSYPSAMGVTDTTITTQIQDGSYQWKANTYEYNIYQEVET